MNNTYAVERVMDIIADVISARKTGTPLAAVDTSILLERGYSASEIAAAISWIIERSVLTAEEPATGFRIYHGIEQSILSIEARGLLITYEELGFLSHDDVEQVLERAVMVGTDRYVDIPEIKAIIAAYLLDGTIAASSSDRKFLLGIDSVH